MYVPFSLCLISLKTLSHFRFSSDMIYKTMLVKISVCTSIHRVHAAFSIRHHYQLNKKTFVYNFFKRVQVRWINRIAWRNILNLGVKGIVIYLQKGRLAQSLANRKLLKTWRRLITPIMPMVVCHIQPTILCRGNKIIDF